MQLVDMLFDEIEDAKKRRVPFIIPIGTIEYHAHHASLLYALYPDHVDLERTKDNTEWFAESAKEASMELGQHMVKCTLEALKEIIV